MNEITDTYGRKFSNLRVSLLHRCNFACVYCTSGDENQGKGGSCGEEILELKELIRLISQLHKKLSLQTVRLTGGEPLLYPNIEHLIYALKEMGIPEVKLTTNAFLLGRMARKLSVVGLDEVNVSLDAVNAEAFYKVTRRNNLDAVVAGIDAAIAAEIPLKLNAVIMKGINDSEVLPLLDFANQRGVILRYLELMNMGYLYGQQENLLYSQHEMLEQIAGRGALQPLPRAASATARYWKTSDAQVFGIIANESAPFCSDCNRLRLCSNGKIYGCLSNEHGFSIKNLNEEELSQSLLQALYQKQPLRFTGSPMSMLSIGG